MVNVTVTVTMTIHWQNFKFEVQVPNAPSESVLSKTAIFPQKEGRKRETNLHGVREADV